MFEANVLVDRYLVEGCMRCEYGGTPRCKVNLWQAELKLLREIVLSCGLREEVKWGVPCYTSGNKNVVIVSALKNYASIGFIKGVLLKDRAKILVQQGKSSQSARLIPFTSVQQIRQQQEVLRAYILEAVAVEEAGGKVVFHKNPEPVPEELLAKFEESPELKTAFYKLTPGRQRGYILFFSQPKQAPTRISRIEKCREKIMNGEGLNDKYQCK